MLKELAEQTPEYDVLVVSDGSTDRTADVAQAPACTSRRCRSTSASAARSAPGSRSRCGAATSARCSSTPTASTTRSRCSLLLDGLDAGADMVIGSRFAEGGAVTYEVSGIRRRAMKVLQWLVRVLVRQQFTDTSSGFRAFSRPMLEYFAETYPVEYMDSVEALVLACNAGLPGGGGAR